MPSFQVVIGDVLRSAVYCQAYNQVSVNTRDWQVTQIVGTSTLWSTDITIGLDQSFASLMKPMLSAFSTYYGVQLYKRTPVGAAPRPDGTHANAGPGTASGNNLPTQTCGLISLYSMVLGPSGQGRFYMPFPAVSHSETNATPTASYLNLLAALGYFLSTPETYVNAGVSITLTPCLYQPGGAPPREIEEYIARDAWATQRRRGSYGKGNKVPF